MQRCVKLGTLGSLFLTGCFSSTPRPNADLNANFAPNTEKLNVAKCPQVSNGETVNKQSGEHKLASLDPAKIDDIAILTTPVSKLTGQIEIDDLVGTEPHQEFFDFSGPSLQRVVHQAFKTDGVVKCIIVNRKVDREELSHLGFEDRSRPYTVDVSASVGSPATLNISKLISTDAQNPSFGLNLVIMPKASLQNAESIDNAQFAAIPLNLGTIGLEKCELFSQRKIPLVDKSSSPFIYGFFKKEEFNILSEKFRFLRDGLNEISSAFEDPNGIKHIIWADSTEDNAQLVPSCSDTIYVNSAGIERWSNRLAFYVGIHEGTHRYVERSKGELCAGAVEATFEKIRKENPDFFVELAGPDLLGLPPDYKGGHPWDNSNELVATLMENIYSTDFDSRIVKKSLKFRTELKDCLKALVTQLNAISISPQASVSKLVQARLKTLSEISPNSPD